MPCCAISEAQPLFSHVGFSQPLKFFACRGLTLLRLISFPCCPSPPSVQRLSKPAGLLLAEGDSPRSPRFGGSPGGGGGGGRAMGTARCQCSAGDRTGAGGQRLPPPPARPPLALSGGRQRPRLHQRLGEAGGSPGTPLKQQQGLWYLTAEGITPSGVGFPCAARV